jgi:hypothetical protein
MVDVEIKNKIEIEQNQEKSHSPLIPHSPFLIPYSLFLILYSVFLIPYASIPPQWHLQSAATW